MQYTAIGVVCSIGLGILTGYLFKKSEEIKSPSATSTTPVIYHAWNGTVHTFSLANRAFYEDFYACNQGKVVNT
jgi:hypothetical protein